MNDTNKLVYTLNDWVYVNGEWKHDSAELQLFIKNLIKDDLVSATYTKRENEKDNIKDDIKIIMDNINFCFDASTASIYAKREDKNENEGEKEYIKSCFDVSPNHKKEELQMHIKNSMQIREILRKNRRVKRNIKCDIK